jgi:release factor glutamine methyltransferase
MNSPSAANLPTTLGQLHREAKLRLAQAGVETPSLDARLLVEHFSGTTRTQAISEPERPVDASAVATIVDALARRLAGEPVHRILGFREFYGLRLSLSPGTLEPRPDTETLVEAALARVKSVTARKGGCRILDLGTGTGAIALALLSEVAGAVATGVDVSEDALATAARNAGELGLSGRFTLLKSDWFSRVSGQYDVIVSNPPYISTNDMATLQAEVREYDPLRALDGGEDGLLAYRLIAEGAKAFLAPDGYIAVEIGATQRADVTGIFIEAGLALVEARRDLGGNDRVLVFNAASGAQR